MEYDTPISTLLKECNQLSVHQLIVYHTANQVYKISSTKLPKYHYNRLFYEDHEKQDLANTRASDINMKRIDFDLSLARGSFFYQGSRMWTLLPPNIRNSPNLRKFKSNCKKWIQNNVKIRV